LLAVLAVDLWSFALSGMSAAMGSAEMGVTIAVVLVALFLVWLAYSADGKGWLS
jgi:hypothetical protein